MSENTPGSLQGGAKGWRACPHTPSRVAPRVGRHPLHPQGSATDLLTVRSSVRECVREERECACARGGLSSEKENNQLPLRPQTRAAGCIRCAWECA